MAEFLVELYVSRKDLDSVRQGAIGRLRWAPLDASSTMTGVAEAADAATIVIAQPDYVCDDGSEAQALSGPPLLEQLRNLRFTYSPGSDELMNAGLVWGRV
jgi:hypothetical protein